MKPIVKNNNPNMFISLFNIGILKNRKSGSVSNIIQATRNAHLEFILRNQKTVNQKIPIIKTNRLSALIFSLPQ